MVQGRLLTKLSSPAGHCPLQASPNDAPAQRPKPPSCVRLAEHVPHIHGRALGALGTPPPQPRPAVRHPGPLASHSHVRPHPSHINRINATQSTQTDKNRTSGGAKPEPPPPPPPRPKDNKAQSIRSNKQNNTALFHNAPPPHRPPGQRTCFHKYSPRSCSYCCTLSMPISVR